MSRTQRKYMTNSNHREARGGRYYVRRSSPQPLNTDMFVHLREPKAPWGKSRARGGNMLMGERSSGLWSDELPFKSSADKKSLKRSIKRSERQRVHQELEDAWAEMYEDALDEHPWEALRDADYFEFLLPGSLDELYADDELFYPEQGYDEDSDPYGLYC